MGDFFMGLIKLGLFFQFGLPILVGILVLIVSAFAPGSILSFSGRLSRKKYFLYGLGDFALLMVGMLLAFWGEAQSMSAVMDVGLILAVVSFIFFYSQTAARLWPICLVVFGPFCDVSPAAQRAGHERCFEPDYLCRFGTDSRRQREQPVRPGSLGPHQLPGGMVGQAFAKPLHKLQIKRKVSFPKPKQGKLTFLLYQRNYAPANWLLYRSA